MINFGEYGDRPFSELFHVSLRKGVDSKYSSLAWNYLHLCDEGVISNFCSYVDEQLKQVETDKLTGEILAEACKSWNWDQRKPNSHRPLFDDDANTHAIVLHGIIQFMPQEDYNDVAGFMVYCIGYSSGS